MLSSLYGSLHHAMAIGPELVRQAIDEALTLTSLPRQTLTAGCTYLGDNHRSTPAHHSAKDTQTFGNT